MPEKDDDGAPRPFGVMLRRPGNSHGVFITPGYDDPAAIIRLETDDFYPGLDPRGYRGEGNWSLSLPHQCDEWLIADGNLGQVIAAAERFRTELDQAISALHGARE